MAQSLTTHTNDGRRILRLRNEKNGRLIAEVVVSEAIYRAYYQEHEHASYLAKKASRHECSWQRLEEDEGMPVDARLAASAGGPSPALVSALYDALATLPAYMREALWQLACGETTERALAARWGISKSSVHKRKTRALDTLKQQLIALGYHHSA